MAMTEPAQSPRSASVRRGVESYIGRLTIKLAKEVMCEERNSEMIALKPLLELVDEDAGARLRMVPHPGIQFANGDGFTIKGEEAVHVTRI
jgi:hypothetical protein